MYLHDLIEHLLDYNSRHVGPGFVALLQSEFKSTDPVWYLVPAHTPGAIGSEAIPGKSVTIPRGQEGIVAEYTAGQIVVDLINSPGQPRLSSAIGDGLWATTTTAPPAPVKSTSRYRFFGTI